jgi:hypothetical protein
MHLGESNKLGRYLLNLSKRSLKIKWMVIILRCITLTLNDQVVYDHITVHHLPHPRFRPSGSRVPNNGKTLLDHTKIPLDYNRSSPPTTLTKHMANSSNPSACNRYSEYSRKSSHCILCQDRSCIICIGCAQIV